MHLGRTPSGGWFAVVQHRGRRRRVHGRTRAEAVRRAGHALVELGGTPDLATVTVGELVADYIDDRAGRCSPTWYDEAVRASERLPDDFAARLAATVNGAVLNALYHRLAADYAPSAVHRVHEVVTAAYRRAERLGLIDRAPLAQPPPVPDRDVHPHTHEQARAILAAAATPLERIALRLAATIGGRRGETVAVRWDDLDLAAADLHVRRSLVVTRRAGIVERATKTGWKGHRHVALDPTLAFELQEWRARQAALADAAGLPPPVWVFSDNAGVAPWRPDRLTHVYAAARTRAGVPPGVRLQDLRHYVATTMLADGVPVARVAQQLGHTSTATTERVYAHWIKPDDQARADAERRAQRLD